MTMPYAYAYLHGFAGSSLSKKGVLLKERFAAHGRVLHLPDMNVPDFERFTYSGALQAIDALDQREGRGVTWRFIGSSLGGYTAARWAAQNPGRVDRAVLLCPGFDMMTRWPQLLGDDAFALWERNGAFFFVAPNGEPRPVSFNLIIDAKSHPARPAIPCPTLLFHGTADEIVPIDSSRRYAAEHQQVRLVEVDDDHSMYASIEIIPEQTLVFFD